LADIVGITIYRKLWIKELKIYLTHYWFSPFYYWLKAELIKKIFEKEVISVELQAEPWGLSFYLIYLLRNRKRQ
jgi:hypothetical protein